MKTTLVIMAAGIGSRFGGGIKQLAPVGLNGEIIMDYSIHDAIEAGFNKIVLLSVKILRTHLKKQSVTVSKRFATILMWRLLTHTRN